MGGRGEGGRTVDEEAPIAVLVGQVVVHGVLEQLHGDFHGHDRAFFDVVLDQAAELAAFAVLLLPQQVPC